MKIKILEALKRRFENLGINESVLDRFATKLAGTITDESMIESEVEKVTFDRIHQSELDAKITDSNKKAVDNAKGGIIADWAKENGIELDNGKPKEKKTPPSDAPDWFVAYKAEQDQLITGLKSEINGYKNERTSETIKAKVIAGLNEKKIPKEFYESINIAVTDPEKIPDEITRIETQYTGLKQSMVNQGIMFDKPQESVIDIKEADINGYLDSKFPTETKEN